MNFIESAGFFTGPMTSEAHSHTCCEIFYFKKGRIKVTIAGKEYMPPENSVYLVSPMEIHEITCLSEVYERYIIFLNLHNFEVYCAIPTLAFILKNRPQEFHHLFQAATTELETIFQNCANEYVNHQVCQFYNQRMVNLITDLLIYLYRGNPERFLLNKDNKRLSAIQRYIEEHYEKPLKISELADHFFINQYYLSHTFKAFTGYSPKQYLTKVRFIHARQLLVTTDIKILEIAEQSGFESTNDFSRQFKNEFGISPTEYRKINPILS